ncbi:hypothetical protein [Halosimplex sp. TS25]|uniref:hypothetical protein n=1 Tax=Halosimplex rarum TaxID=3396619 RepID=UPI0039EC971A
MVSPLLVAGIAVAAAEDVAGPPDADDSAVSIDAIAEGDAGTGDGPSGAGDVATIGEEDPEAVTVADLFDPAATGRVVLLWVLTPSLSAVASYLVFQYLPIV